MHTSTFSLLLVVTLLLGGTVHAQVSPIDHYCTLYRFGTTHILINNADSLVTGFQCTLPLAGMGALTTATMMKSAGAGVAYGPGPYVPAPASFSVTPADTIITGGPAGEFAIVVIN